MKIIAPIPVFGRHELVKLTASRLQLQGITPVLIGHEPETKEIAKNLNIEFCLASNNPLGHKWNVGFQAAKFYDPDAVIFMGSSDWCSQEYIDIVKQNLNFSMIGMLGCHFIDVADQIRLVHWDGYKDKLRMNEPIGIGRVLSRELIKKMNWIPFENVLNSGLDWSMYQKVLRLREKIAVIPNDPMNVRLMSISTNKWINKHKFLDHWSGPLKSHKIEDLSILDTHFPDIHILHETLKK